MKNIKNKYILAIIALFFILLGENVYGQSESRVRVNIIFKPIQTLTVNPAQEVVNIEFNTLEDYAQGVENLQRGHLTVSSTSNYEITVQARESHLEMVNGDGELSVSNLRIAAILPQQVQPGISVSSIQLDQFGKSIISSMRPSLETTFDISYHGLSMRGMLEQVNQRGTSTYSTELIYTISTK